MAALYLQVSIISQALIFVTRSRSWSYVERPGLLLLGAFMIAQLVSFCQKHHFFKCLCYSRISQNFQGLVKSANGNNNISLLNIGALMN